MLVCSGCGKQVGNLHNEPQKDFLCFPCFQKSKISINQNEVKKNMICIHCNGTVNTSTKYCIDCETCNCSGCQNSNKPIKSKEEKNSMIKTLKYEPKTQKALGVKVLAENGFSVPNYFVQSANDPIDPKRLPSFIRPCPIEARHGFIDSRFCSNELEAEQVRQETLEEDKQGELLFMPRIDAKYSMVLTPKAVAIGKGNDGATAGKGAITIPLKLVKVSESMKVQANVTKTPYFEVLYENPYSIKYVQMRNGNYMGDGEFTKAWIPETMKITNILDYANFEKNGVAWEKACAVAPKGTACVHIGGGILDHSCQHAEKNHMPIVFDCMPAIGDTLKKNTGIEPLPKMKEFINGLKAESIFNHTENGSMQLLLTAVHQASAMVGNEHGAFIVGLAVRKILTLAYSACIGEARHAHKKKVSRDSIYSKVLKVGTSESRKRMLNARKLFYVHKFHAGYGGKAWAECAEVTLRLEHALDLFVKAPTVQKLKNILSAVHNVINTAHNNGAFLNKFCQTQLFDLASQGDIKTTVVAMFKAYSTIQYAETIPVTSDMELKALKFQRYRKFKMPPIAPIVYKQVPLGQIDTKLQFKVEPNGVLHFQIGKNGVYKSFNIELSLDEKRLFIQGNDGYFGHSTSFNSGSPTKYYQLLPNFPSALIPIRLKEMIKTLCGFEVK